MAIPRKGYGAGLRFDAFGVLVRECEPWDRLWFLVQPNSLRDAANFPGRQYNIIRHFYAYPLIDCRGRSLSAVSSKSGLESDPRDR